MEEDQWLAKFYLQGFAGKNGTNNKVVLFSCFFSVLFGLSLLREHPCRFRQPYKFIVQPEEIVCRSLTFLDHFVEPFPQAMAHLGKMPDVEEVFDDEVGVGDFGGGEGEGVGVVGREGVFGL